MTSLPKTCRVLDPNLSSRKMISFHSYNYASQLVNVFFNFVTFYACEPSFVGSYDAQFGVAFNAEILEQRRPQILGPSQIIIPSSYFDYPFLILFIFKLY